MSPSTTTSEAGAGEQAPGLAQGRDRGGLGERALHALGVPALAGDRAGDRHHLVQRRHGVGVGVDHEVAAQGGERRERGDRRAEGLLYGGDAVGVGGRSGAGVEGEEVDRHGTVAAADEHQLLAAAGAQLRLAELAAQAGQLGRLRLVGEAAQRREGEGEVLDRDVDPRVRAESASAATEVHLIAGRLGDRRRRWLIDRLDRLQRIDLGGDRRWDRWRLHAIVVAGHRRRVGGGDAGEGVRREVGAALQEGAHAGGVAERAHDGRADDGVGVDAEAGGDVVDAGIEAQLVAGAGEVADDVGAEREGLQPALDLARAHRHVQQAAARKPGVGPRSATGSGGIRAWMAASAGSSLRPALPPPLQADSARVRAARPHSDDETGERDTAASMPREGAAAGRGRRVCGW